MHVEELEETGNFSRQLLRKASSLLLLSNGHNGSWITAINASCSVLQDHIPISKTLFQNIPSYFTNNVQKQNISRISYNSTWIVVLSVLADAPPQRHVR